MESWLQAKSPWQPEFAGKNEPLCGYIVGQLWVPFDFGIPHTWKMRHMESWLRPVYLDKQEFPAAAEGQPELWR